MPSRRSGSGREPARLAGPLRILLAVITIGNLAASCGLKAPSAVPPRNEQVQLQSSIVNDRKHLFNGVLTYLPLRSMPVEDTQELEVELIAIGQNAAAVRIPEGRVVGSRSFKVGGVEEAKLSVSGGGVDIAPVSPARATIGQPGDSVTWRWDLTPKEPGDYTLKLEVITYQGTSDRPLAYINPPVRIGLSVTNTLSHRIKTNVPRIVGFVTFIGVLAGAIAGVRSLVVRQRKRGRRR
jgi:hypothetical protein